MAWLSAYCHYIITLEFSIEKKKSNLRCTWTKHQDTQEWKFPLALRSRENREYKGEQLT